MRPLRILIASLAILAISTSSFAGDFQDSVAKAARDAAGQQAEQRSGNRNPYLWPGAARFARATRRRSRLVADASPSRSKFRGNRGKAPLLKQPDARIRHETHETT